MRLAVVGSTNTTQWQRDLAATIIKGHVWVHQPEIIISGGAKGIDSVAEYVADALGVPFEKHLPQIMHWEPFGFKDRNLIIANECTHPLSIRTNQSTTYGSGWTADRAQDLGKIVWRITV